MSHYLSLFPSSARNNQKYVPFLFFFLVKDLCNNLIGLPGGSVVKNQPVSAGDRDSIAGLGRSPEEEMATHHSIFA